MSRYFKYVCSECEENVDICMECGEDFETEDQIGREIICYDDKHFCNTECMGSYLISTSNAEDGTIKLIEVKESEIHDKNSGV